jgi:hypothetical protein
MAELSANVCVQESSPLVTILLELNISPSCIEIMFLIDWVAIFMWCIVTLGTNILYLVHSEI